MVRENIRAHRAARPVSPGRLMVQLCGAFGTGAILLFADMSELRVYFEFAPLWLLLATEPAGPPTPAPQGG